MTLDPNQALLTGQIAGLLMRLNADDKPGSLLDLHIEVIDGNYTNRIFVTRPSGRYTVIVEGPVPLPREFSQTDEAIAARERTRQRLEGR